MKSISEYHVKIEKVVWNWFDNGRYWLAKQNIC